MEEKISIIYANRNRDLERIKISLDSLVHQSAHNFEVIFVDHGSQPDKVEGLKVLFNKYPFVSFHALPVSQQLWNKSVALNHGIKKATHSYIFIADVDLIFHPDAINLLAKNLNKSSYSLFQLGYLDEKETKKLHNNYDFSDLSPSRFGNINGMVLAHKNAFIQIQGFDQFFHFYGGEDVDLFCRLENAGFLKNEVRQKYFYHIWHPSFAIAEDKEINKIPRVKNIMRINQEHYLQNKFKKVVVPIRQKTMGEVIDKEKSNLLNFPTKKFTVLNRTAQVEHFLNEELPAIKGEIIKVDFKEDPYCFNVKYKIKKMLGIKHQPFLSLKEINDLILKKIVFEYRNENYSYEVSENLKTITFCIEL